MQDLSYQGRSNLYAIPTGCYAKVQSIGSNAGTRQRILDMGVLPGCQVYKERCALGGDPIWVTLEGVQLALRKTEAEAITVTLI